MDDPRTPQEQCDHWLARLSNDDLGEALLRLDRAALDLRWLHGDSSRDNIREADRCAWAACAATLVNAVFSSDVTTNVSSRPLCARLLTHTRTLTDCKFCPSSHRRSSGLIGGSNPPSLIL